MNDTKIRLKPDLFLILEKKCQMGQIKKQEVPFTVELFAKTRKTNYNS